MTSPGEGVTVFTSPYLSAGAPAQGGAKGLNNNICILNFKDNNHEDSEQDILIKNLENYFISEDYNTTNIEQGEDEIYQEESFTITFTSSENQKNNL